MRSVRRGGGHRVLLVEDDPAVRTLTARMLERLGYAVLIARDAFEARELAGAERERIDLLLTDVVMPGTTGPELARELTAARLGLKTLFVSGYARDAAVLSELLAAGHRLLAKPFSSVELGRVLAELLVPPPEER